MSKKIIWLFITSISSVQLAFSQTETKLAVVDSRDVVTVPTTYARNFGLDFKRSSVLKLPASSYYATVMGFRGWKDDTGGKAHEIAFTDGDVYVHSGLNAGWGNWRKILIENEAGNIGIGTSNPTSKLSVNGNIRAKEIKVETANWPDYVFDAGYKMPSLIETEAYIKTHKHLPGMPGKETVARDGVSLGEMNKILVEKVEELTLRLIEKEKKVSAISDQLSLLSKEVKELKKNQK